MLVYLRINVNDILQCYMVGCKTMCHKKNLSYYILIPAMYYVNIYTVFTFEYILTQWTVNLLKIWMFVLWNMLLGIYVVFIFTEASDECFNFCFCKIYVKLISWHWSIWGCKYCRKTYSEIGQFHYNQGDRVGSSLSVYATVRS